LLIEDSGDFHGGAVSKRFFVTVGLIVVALGLVSPLHAQEAAARASTGTEVVRW